MKSILWIAVAILATNLHTYAIEIMDELVVQSTRIETPLDLMSSSVEVITAEELQASGVSYMVTHFYSNPESVVTCSGGAGQATQIYLRGAKPQHTLILVDGVRMNGQLDLNGYDLANLDLNSVERIEILKGPQSTLYGSDAMAGVINIITTKVKRPVDTSSAKWVDMELNIPQPGSAAAPNNWPTRSLILITVTKVFQASK